MKIIGSRRSLFVKTGVIGLAIVFISFALLYYNYRNNKSEIDRNVHYEAEAYFDNIQKMANRLGDNIAKDAATLLVKHLENNHDLRQALLFVREDIARKGVEDARVIVLDQDNNVVTEPTGIDSGYISKYLKLNKSGRVDGLMSFQDKVYLISICPVQYGSAGRQSIAIMLPLEYVFSAVDQDRRLQSPLILQSEQTKPSLSNSLLFMPINTFDGEIAGYLGINPALGLVNISNISNWEIIALGLLPLIGLFLFVYMLYKYFESFTGHSAILRKILKRERHGIEIFRRDQQIAKNEIPELSEFFELVDESLNEKANLKKTLDMVSATLSALHGIGRNPAAVSEIIELIVNSADASAGAFFSVDPIESRIEVLGKCNCTAEFISGICQTSMGQSLIKYVEKKESYLYFCAKELPDEPWRILLELYQNVIIMPVSLNSHVAGVLILMSSEPMPFLREPGYVTNLLSELLTKLVYELDIEKDRLERYDKTKILQETSLAISSKLDLPSVLQVVASHLTDYADATYCLILLNTEIDGIMEVASFHSRRQQGINSPDLARINAVDLPRVAEAMATRRMLIFGSQDLFELTGMERRFFRADSIKLLTILPISHSAKAIGAVILGEERAKPRASIAPDKLSFVQAIVSQAASAIENARLYGFINKKVDQLTTLYNVSAVIHSETNINSMLNKVLIAIQNYMHFSVAAVYSIDNKTNNITPLVVNALELTPGTDKISRRTLETVSDKVASIGQSVIINDFRVETDIGPSFPKLLSELGVPLKSGNKTTGVLIVGSQTQCAFGEMHENFLKALADQIALAMERGRLYEHEHERGLKLNTIFEFSKKLSKSLNVQEVIKIAGDSIRDAFSYQFVAVFLLDRDNHRYYTGYQASLSDKKLPPEFGVAEGCGLVGAAIKSKKTVYCSDVQSEPDYVLGIEEVKSEICIPIIVADKILGVLDVESMEYDDFSNEDIGTLEALADIMAVAIDNSYLFEETIQKAERLSLIDNINKAIFATLDLDSFFRVVARAVSDNAGYRWTSLVVPDGTSFIFKAGYTPRSVGIISTEAMLELLKGKLESVIGSAAPEFLSFSQLTSLGSAEKLQSIVDAGIRNLALFPIGDESRAEAVMIVGSSRSEGFSSQELQLLKDLAIHLRIAWQNAQLYKELKTAYEQIQDAQDRIVQTEKLRALGEMSSGVVHDFNNILAAILGRLQILRKKLDNYEEWSGRQFLENNLELIEKAANDGSHILSRISEFTKKKPSEKFVEVNLQQIIADTIELTRPRWHDQALARGKSIDMKFHYTGDLITTGSPSELREIFINLINNSIDAMNGDGKISIEARLESESEILITLEDNGTGMSVETRNKIFEPFFTTKGAGGTGLGLSVTYGIITRHKGTINVESELDRGTKFIINIPVRELSQEATASINPINPDRKLSKILVVDDEEGFREILVEILASGGHEADSASNAIAALEMMNAKAYDMVITDLGMTGLSGWELADAVYRNHPAVRVIMATGWGANIDKENLNLHHIDSIIGKPFKIEEIFNVVDQTLKSSRKEVLVEQD